MYVYIDKIKKVEETGRKGTVEAFGKESAQSGDQELGMREF